jgi:hemoglobin
MPNFDLAICRFRRPVCARLDDMVSLYEFAGGEPAFSALATAHHARCLADPELNHPFSHHDQDPQHLAHLAAYWAEVLGGPPRYSSEFGDQAAVVAMHSGNGDMSDLNRRFLDCFVQAMDDAGLPDDPAFRTAMRDYMRWATREVSGRDDAEPALTPGTPMPRWSWDGLQALD